ncbi:adenylate/guanylate cyclase domain-containing protein [Roseibium porphyridii]|uniref:Adenylate/guanylate cyclase domain-containing protein n=1 Tax=Roseibium porphyridii TaxID=2866279 RepID=A0ABY8F234_9HYPH|nr:MULTISPECIES: adenylate/guanylate cyclase domain-containing protein [Stappiaceae]QFT34578.1 Adenylate cyclase 1 [Labrenzia sp. THAF82]WFE89548.1 adenylate/guanylate cyclase domain-containing protein [Roseibium sp. KMA01]
MSALRMPSPFRFIARLRQLRDDERQQASSNQFLAQALENEKMEGHRLAVIARTVAMSIVALLLPFLNPSLSVLYYEAWVAVFIALGWLQLRLARVGYSRTELGLIFLDVSLLTLLFITPNPFFSEDVPTAFIYRFDNFIYFFIFLAAATLAYSWRTVWAIGTWVGVLWLAGFIYVAVFGQKIPELSEATAIAFEGHSIVGSELDPNSVRPSVRIQEIVVFLIVAAMLALKGWRSNQLLMRQANLAAERANLSRYFPSSLVDVLASTDRDIGAVRTQEVAVLFTDIVGFTQFAEHHSPEEVMDLLRHYHAFVERSIFQNGGTLDKYLGDGVMATFGTPETKSGDAANALKAALQLIDETEAFNKDLQSRGIEPIKVSVGVHFGPVILGDIGPSRRLEFAVVGDTVNVASRLEASTRELGCKCVVSEELMRRAGLDENASNPDFKFSAKNQIKLRGRETSINVWTV